MAEDHAVTSVDTSADTTEILVVPVLVQSLYEDRFGHRSGSFLGAREERLFVCYVTKQWYIMEELHQV